MAQIQIAMEVDDVDEMDFSSLAIDDRDGKSEWIVLRVKRSREYFEAALPILRRFMQTVLSRTRPPPKGCFTFPTESRVKTEMLIHKYDAIQMLPGWDKSLSDTLVAAHNIAEATAEKNKLANAAEEKARQAAEAAAQKCIDDAFVNDG